MAKKKQKKSKGNANSAVSDASSGGLMIDPSQIRFQHARIRPFFSGCGRSVEGTLEEIRQGKIQPKDLPPIQVLVGPLDPDTGLPWYFSLNNRRLWVLKRCREEGLLGPNNLIFVRVRQPKSEQERERYSVSNCALEAKLMIEKAPKGGPTKNQTEKEEVEKDVETNVQNDFPGAALAANETDSQPKAEASESDDDSDSSDDNVSPGVFNRFSALSF
eukprot:Nitzschia sp. Nitz4//scaffold341_size29662//14548//15198//NITZ4_008038-RA/size29662-processed-gene-0.22-mRNA-1//1//CDS//3329548546//1844//frame0